MLKKHKSTIIITSIVTIVPIIIGLILWNKLPETIATHFNVNNEPDGYSSKAFAVFGLPLIMLGIHLMCLAATNLDPKNKNLTPKLMKLVLWIAPVTSLVLMGMTYAYALGSSIRMGFAAIMLIGILFIVFGNYMPKTRHNYTVGMKLPWTLDSEENWNKTHRLTGKVMVICGALICATAIFESPFIFFTLVILTAAIPTVYSYRLYKNK